MKNSKKYNQKDSKDNIKEIKFKMMDGDQLSILLLFRINSRFNFNRTQNMN